MTNAANRRSHVKDLGCSSKFGSLQLKCLKLTMEDLQSQTPVASGLSDGFAQIVACYQDVTTKAGSANGLEIECSKRLQANHENRGIYTLSPPFHVPPLPSCTPSNMQSRVNDVTRPIEH